MDTLEEARIVFEQYLWQAYRTVAGLVPIY
jgi:hypothetical protein